MKHSENEKSFAASYSIGIVMVVFGYFTVCFVLVRLPAFRFTFNRQIYKGC